MFFTKDETTIVITLLKVILLDNIYGNISTYLNGIFAKDLGLFMSCTSRVTSYSSSPNRRGIPTRQIIGNGERATEKIWDNNAALGHGVLAREAKSGAFLFKFHKRLDTEEKDSLEEGSHVANKEQLSSEFGRTGHNWADF